MQQKYIFMLQSEEVLGYNALTAGLTQLPLAGALVIFAGVVPGLIAKVGTRWTLTISLLIFAVGLIWLSFAVHLLGPSIVIGIGHGGAFVSGTELAVHGVNENDAGLASGLVNTSQQKGGAIGLAVSATIAASRTNGLLTSGSSKADALTGGFAWVFLGAALCAIAGAVIIALGTSSRQSRKEIRVKL